MNSSEVRCCYSTDVGVLVSGDCEEASLGKEVRQQWLRTLLLRIRVHFDDVNARLVAMHRVENDLKTFPLQSTCSRLRNVTSRVSYVAVVSRSVVCDFEFSEAYSFLHPV